MFLFRPFKINSFSSMHRPHLLWPTQPSTQDQVGNHKENPGLQTRPEKMWPMH